MSLYLFILCVDYLSQLIKEKCNNKLWNLVKASRSGPAFSHLMSTDDLILFAKADLINCSTIKDVLGEFCAVSSHTIGEVKSKVYFSPNVDRDTRESLSDILRFASTQNLGKCLSIPIKHPSSLSQDFNFILDKVEVISWKANLISLTGRAMLIQASSLAIPSYVMQYSHLPSRIMQGLDRMNINFLWGLTKTM